MKPEERDAAYLWDMLAAETGTESVPGLIAALQKILERL